jgi:hypothetical protein
MWNPAILHWSYIWTILAMFGGDPKPVSASAMSGTRLSMLAIIWPFWAKSLREANARSARPRREAVVIDPDWYCNDQNRHLLHLKGIARLMKLLELTMTWKPCSIAILAQMPSYTPGAWTQTPSCDSSFRSLVEGFM